MYPQPSPGHYVLLSQAFILIILGKKSAFTVTHKISPISQSFSMQYVCYSVIEEEQMRQRSVPEICQPYPTPKGKQNTSACGTSTQMSSIELSFIISIATLTCFYTVVKKTVGWFNSRVNMCLDISSVDEILVTVQCTIVS